MHRGRPFAILLLLALSSAAAREASAFCRTSTCLPRGVVCEVPGPEDCGFGIAWPVDCVGIAIQQEGTVQLPFQDTRAAILNGFAAWMSPVCDGVSPGIATIDLGNVACADVEYNTNAGNVNVVVFRDRAWTHPEGANYIALTTVTFNDQTGEIYDTDMEINSAGFELTLMESEIGFDLQAIITHEAGHFYGLAHSDNQDSTMFEAYEEGMGGQRTLAADDMRGICSIYPPRAIDSTTCNPLPRHGFASECADRQPKHGCAVLAPGGWAPGALGASLLAALALLAAQRRRRPGFTDRPGPLPRA